MLDRGFFYLPPDRRDEGLVMMRGARENISLPSLGLAAVLRRPFLDRAAREGAGARAGRAAQSAAAQHRAGGRALLRRQSAEGAAGEGAVARRCKLFVFDEPTVGVDVGTRVAIYDFIAELCEAGAAILLISSDLPEILHLTNRAYVMYRGELRAELTGSDDHRGQRAGHFFEREAA